MTTTKKGNTLPTKICKICTRQMNKGKPLDRKTDGKVTMHTRGNLSRHLKKHGVVFGKQPEQPQQPLKLKVKDDAGQSKITQFARFSERQQEEVTQAIVLMCATDNRPFAIVDGRGFRMLLDKATGQRYDIPSRRTIARKCTTMAEQARATTRAVMKEDLDGGATFTMSFDAWKDRCVVVGVGVLTCLVGNGREIGGAAVRPRSNNGRTPARPHVHTASGDTTSR